MVSQADNDGRVVLVTGSRRGIGAALLLAIAQPGNTLIAHVHRSFEVAEAEERVARRARKQGARVIVLQADLSSVEETQGLSRSIIERYGRMDVLVNNAARSSYVAVDGITLDEWQETLAVNLTAPFLLAQAFLPGMIERRSGRVINVTSITENLGGPSGPAYVASKGGLVALTRALARSVRVDGVTINAISPGAVVTEEEREHVPEGERGSVDGSVIARQCLPRRLVPGDLVSALRFLIHEGSNAVTGQVIEVNGGWVFR